MSPDELLSMNEVLRPRCTELHLHHRGGEPERPRSPSSESLTHLNVSILHSSESTTSTARPVPQHPPSDHTMQRAPSILNVHTPSSSFAIIHSCEFALRGKFDEIIVLMTRLRLGFWTVTQESLDELYDKLSRKGHTERYPPRVGPGWLRYEWNGSVWNLDDGAFAVGVGVGLDLLSPPSPIWLPFILLFLNSTSSLPGDGCSTPP